jgi:hypothetical protein
MKTQLAIIALASGRLDIGSVAEFKFRECLGRKLISLGAVLS